MPGGFLVRRLLSRSAHGRLYVAEAPDGTLVALKELVFSLVPEVRQLEAFEREARLLREVSHPHIPRFVASFQEGRGVGLRLYLAQELIQGTSLRELLRERCLREEEALEVARQVLDVLCYLHELSPRIVHRDVKPANLVRREDGKTFLVDFGAARDLFGSGTAGATMVGTFGYMPPEQLGGTLDATCDLYALGASLLHLLSGKHPEELLAPDLSLNVEAHAVLSPKMTRFLRKLVARDPAKRFRSARDARLALESSSGDNRLHWRRAAAAGLVLAVVTGVAVQGWRWSSAAPAPVTKAPPPEWRPEPPLLPEFPPHARWRFDEHGSQLPLGRDDQQRFDLTVTPGMLREGGVRGGSLGFAEHQSVQVVGASEHESQETPRLLEGLEEGSLAVWLRRDSRSGSEGMVLASSGDADPTQVDLGLSIHEGSLEFSAARSQWLRPSLLLTPGVFHHIVATWGEAGTHLYIGGRLVAHDPQPVRGSRKGQTLWLGKSPEAPAETRSPLVTLDDLTLYRGVLPGEAVARLASLENGNRVVAMDYGPSPPLLTDDFSRGLRRWIPLSAAPGVVQEFEVIKDKGNPVLRLSHQAPSGRADSFRYLLVEPRPGGKSGVSRVWLEFDAMLERAVLASGQRETDRSGAGLVMQLVLILNRDGRYTRCLLDVDLSPHTGRPYSSVGPAWQVDSHVVFSQPVRLGHWQHVKLDLNSLIATLGAGTIQQVGNITLIGYGANTEGFLDNLSLVEE